jgi:hypothetical protein
VQYNEMQFRCWGYFSGIERRLKQATTIKAIASQRTPGASTGGFNTMDQNPLPSLTGVAVQKRQSGKLQNGSR